MTDHLDIAAEVHELFAAKLREFAAFCAKEWLLDENEPTYIGQPVTPDFLRGYNAAMADGLESAVEFFLEEPGYV
jgi:hypothetical protein